MSSAIRPFISGVGHGPRRIAQSRSGGKGVVENGSAHDEAMDDGSAQIAVTVRLGEWVGFWYGLEAFRRMERSIRDQSRALPSTAPSYGKT
jgi:hypothetical protein